MIDLINMQLIISLMKWITLPTFLLHSFITHFVIKAHSQNKYKSDSVTLTCLLMRKDEDVVNKQQTV